MEPRPAAALAPANAASVFISKQAIM